MKTNKAVIVTLISTAQLAFIVLVLWATQSGTPNAPRGPLATARAAPAVPAVTPAPAPVVPVTPVAAPVPVAPVPAIALATPAVPAFALPPLPPHDLTIVTYGGEALESQEATYIGTWRTATGQPAVGTSYAGTLADAKRGLQAGETWDVFDMEQADVQRGCEEGVLEPLDWSRIPVRVDFMPSAIEECGIGNVVWSYVLAYKPSAFPRPPVNWVDFWNVEGMPGKRGIRSIAQWTLEIALMADGVPYNEVYTVLRTPQGVDRSFAKLDALKDHVVWWSAGAEPMQMMSAGEVTMTTAYNGRVSGAKKAGVEAEIIWNNVIYTINFWAVTRNTPNMDKVYSYLNHASQPHLMAKSPEYLPYGPSNLKAIPLVKPELQAEMPTNPKNLKFAVLSDAAFWNRNGPELEARFARWLAQ